jgi:hypothetical protein
VRAPRPFLAPQPVNRDREEVSSGAWLCLETRPLFAPQSVRQIVIVMHEVGPHQPDRCAYARLHPWAHDQRPSAASPIASSITPC